MLKDLREGERYKITPIVLDWKYQSHSFQETGHITVQVLTTVGDIKSFIPKHGGIIHNSDSDKKDVIDLIEGDSPSDGSCIFKNLTLNNIH